MKTHLFLTTIVLLGGGVAPGQEAEKTLRDHGRYAPVDDLPEEYVIIEGDIVVHEASLDASGGRATYGTTFWPGGIVPYTFDPNVEELNRVLALDAMAEWGAVANIDFRPRADEPDYLYIVWATFNASEGVGMAGGRHDIWIASWTYKYIIAHELGHALGYWHEQSRADRDTACFGGPCIQINLDNVCQDCCGGVSCNLQFAVRDGGGEFGPYDFDSLMHYDQCSFSDCPSCPNSRTCAEGGRTISIVSIHDMQWQNMIGQVDHLSFWDALVMSFLYPEDDWRFVDSECGCLDLGLCSEDGSFRCPYREFAVGVDATPPNGTLWVLRKGDYSAVGTHSKAMTIRAPLGAILRD